MFLFILASIAIKTNNTKASHKMPPRFVHSPCLLYTVYFYILLTKTSVSKAKRKIPEKKSNSLESGLQHVMIQPNLQYFQKKHAKVRKMFDASITDNVYFQIKNTAFVVIWLLCLCYRIKKKQDCEYRATYVMYIDIRNKGNGRTSLSSDKWKYTKHRSKVFIVRPTI